MAVRYINESDSWATQVTDEEILSAQLELARDAGIFVEPAAACAWAGFVRDSEKLKDTLGADADICVLLTGTGFKDMAVFDGRITLPEPIENSTEAVKERFFWQVIQTQQNGGTLLNAFPPLAQHDQRVALWS